MEKIFKINQNQKRQYIQIYIKTFFSTIIDKLLFIYTHDIIIIVYINNNKYI